MARQFKFYMKDGKHLIFEGLGINSMPPKHYVIIGEGGNAIAEVRKEEVQAWKELDISLP